MKIKNIVTIGGGTGSFVLLSGLKKYPVNISAIVSMADDGGSTGILRDELGVLPPGDVRQCLVAMSNSSQTFRELINYRFANGKLKGHNFGNLLLSALEKIKGNFAEGVREASKILNIRGQIIPVTEDSISLRMKLKNGKLLNGENEINHTFSIEKDGIEKYYLMPKAKPNPRAIKEILKADVIVIGPGNHYCSILPNFLVKGIKEAIIKSRAKVIYNCNLVNKRGHTEKFSLDDYADALNKMLGRERINFITLNIKKPSANLIVRYRRRRDNLIKFSKNDRTKRSYKIVQANLLSSKIPTYSKSDAIASIRSFIRHDPDKLAKVIMTIAKIGERNSLIKEVI